MTSVRRCVRLVAALVLALLAVSFGPREAVAGESYQNAPQGFYLRRSFTQRLLAARFVEAG